LITSGRILPGDIRWNVYDDCWNETDVTQSPKHDIIIGDPVSNFGGVCRPMSAAAEMLNPVPEFEVYVQKPCFITIEEL